MIGLKYLSQIFFPIPGNYYINLFFYTFLKILRLHFHFLHFHSFIGQKNKFRLNEQCTARPHTKKIAQGALAAGYYSLTESATFFGLFQKLNTRCLENVVATKFSKVKKHF